MRNSLIRTKRVSIILSCKYWVYQIFCVFQRQLKSMQNIVSIFVFILFQLISAFQFVFFIFWPHLLSSLHPESNYRIYDHLHSLELFKNDVTLIGGGGWGWGGEVFFKMWSHTLGKIQFHISPKKNMHPKIGFKNVHTTGNSTSLVTIYLRTGSVASQGGGSQAFCDTACQRGSGWKLSNLVF